MRIDKKEPLVKVGSLVMWNRTTSDDYGCLGIVIEHQFEMYDNDGHKTISSSLVVLWADYDRVEYDYDDLYKEFIKVVKF